MKVATYNLRKGGAKRTHWVRMVEDCGVDLLLVQESYPHFEHLPPLMFPDADARVVWEPVGGRPWGSGLYSTSGKLTPVAVPDYAGWAVGAELTGAAWQEGFAEPLLVFSVHTPHRGESYARQTNKILDEIGKVAGGRAVVIGGDFNLTVSHYAESKRPVSKQDLAIQVRLADEFGLINCWQAANPGQPLCQTLRWTGDKTTAYHCDGKFVPRAWRDRLRSCLVLSGDEWDKLSDHNPIITEFE